MRLIAVTIILALNLMACGSNHYQYIQGTPGDKGDPGDVGDTGPQGAPGQDATPVTVVKLCPGTTVYPSTFVEIAFCIGGKLYGTYSANGGFSTELPAGTYGSNGINASCNFVILPNCVISNN
jgi:hypothetical protein